MAHTTWIDTKNSGGAQRTSGTARVVYRIRRDSSGLYRLSGSTVTLERNLLKPEIDPDAAILDTTDLDEMVDPDDPGSWLISSGGDPLDSREDLCRFVRFDESRNDVSFHVEYLDRLSDPPTYVEPARGEVHHFSLSHPDNPTLRTLPIAIRIKMQVVDRRADSIRTAARTIWIPAGQPR